MAKKKTTRKAASGSAKRQPVVLLDQIEPMIHTVRGQRVILDRHLATLYGMPTKCLNEQVRRNAACFPDGFLFRLTAEDASCLRSQIVTLKSGWGHHSKYLTFGFSQSSRSQAAIRSNLQGLGFPVKS